MSKSKKLGALALCALVSASTLAISPEVINKVQADDVTIENVQTSYAIDDEGKVKIPRATGTSETKVYALGSDTEEVDLTTADDYFVFKPTASQYSVVYSNGGTSKTFIVSIDYKDATFSLDESKVIMPETSVKNYEIVLPYPVIKNENGEVIDLDYTDNNQVNIKVANKSTSTIDVTESDVVYKDNIKFKKFKPTTAGTYTVTYTITKVGYDIIVKTYTIAVKPELETQAEITFTLNSSLPTITLNKECTLPTVTAKDKTNELSNIKVRTDISYYVLDQSGNASEEVAIENFKFTPKAEGYYVFKYVVTDAFGNKSKVRTFRVDTKVTDTQAPTDVVYGGSYKVVDGEAYLVDDLGEVTEEKIYDLTCRIPTNVNTGVEFSLPAIFAKDNDSNLTYKRTLKRYENGIMQEEIDLGENDCTKLIKIAVTNAGNYILSYKVIDANSNETNRDFNITVYGGSWVDTVAPEITMPANIDNSVKWGSKVSISKPTSVDYNDGGQVSDKNTENIGKYYYKVDNGVDPASTTTEKIVRINSSSKFEFEIYSSVAELEDEIGIADLSAYEIFLCFAYTSIDDNGNSETEVKEISILGNTELPGVVYTAPAPVAYTQQDEVALGDVDIEYATAKFAEYLNDIDVSFEIINRQSLAPVISYGSSYSIVGGVLTVSGTKFLATYSGDYDIVITVTDINGNTYITTTAIEGVAEIVNNGRLVLDKDTMEIELGSTDTSAKIYTMYKNGAKVVETEDNFKIEIQTGTSAYIDSNKNIVAKSIGTTIFVFKMYTEDGLTLIDSKTLEVVVQDTEKPEMAFDKDQPFDGIYKAGDEISLPIPKVTDKSGITAAGLVIKVTHNSSDVTVTDNKFTPTEDGTYTVEYKVTDNAGNSTTKTFSVGVGDLDGPSVDIKNVPASKEVGSVYTIDVNDLIVYDEYEGEAFVMKLGENTIITLKDSLGNEIKSISEDGYSYKLESAGSYTLTITATDSSNKTTSIDKTIVVSEPEPEPASTSVAGTVVAILASLFILAFVIYYFFKPEKATPSKKKNTNKAKQDKKENE